MSLDLVEPVVVGLGVFPGVLEEGVEAAELDVGVGDRLAVDHLGDPTLDAEALRQLELDGEDARRRIDALTGRRVAGVALGAHPEGHHGRDPLHHLDTELALRVGGRVLDVIAVGVEQLDVGLGDRRAVPLGDDPPLDHQRAGVVDLNARGRPGVVLSGSACRPRSPPACRRRSPAVRRGRRRSDRRPGRRRRRRSFPPLLGVPPVWKSDAATATPSRSSSRTNTLARMVDHLDVAGGRRVVRFRRRSARRCEPL